MEMLPQVISAETCTSLMAKDCEIQDKGFDDFDRTESLEPFTKRRRFSFDSDLSSHMREPELQTASNQYDSCLAPVATPIDGRAHDLLCNFALEECSEQAIVLKEELRAPSFFQATNEKIEGLAHEEGALSTNPLLDHDEDRFSANNEKQEISVNPLKDDSTEEIQLICHPPKLSTELKNQLDTSVSPA